MIDKNELQEMDRKTITFMTMINAPKKCGCTVVCFQKKWWKRTYGCENSVKSEENGVDSYVKNNIESPIIAVKTRSIIT